MREDTSLASEVRRAISGDPWFGPSGLALLSDVDAATARARFPGVNHSVWEIVRHLSVWANYVGYRLKGGTPRDPEEGNWPEVVRTDEAAWLAALEDLRSSHEVLVDALATMSNEALDAITDSTPYDEMGEPVTLRRTVEGVVQHAAYHLGQIAVLKQLAAQDARQE